jgi:uncharacterized protein YndB with AHSA1/START domain
MSIFKTSRQLSASPAQVFAAIADPAKLAQWWGPQGFSNRFKVFEFKVGGRWVFDMIGPDGTVYPNESVFAQIEGDRHVLIQHTVPPIFSLSITLNAAANGTDLLWAQAFEDPAVAQAVSHIVEPANEQNLDRLEQVLKALT